MFFAYLLVKMIPIIDMTMIDKQRAIIERIIWVSSELLKINVKIINVIDSRLSIQKTT